MKKPIFILIFLSSIFQAFGQQLLSLDGAIAIAHEQSPQVQAMQLSFMSGYWNHRSRKAELLPALSLNGSIANYNRSLVQLQDYNTGEIRYIYNNTLSNSLGLALTQSIPLTGGTLSLNTNLYRLDQLTNKSITYTSIPITINYTQPIGTYNELKWKKKTTPIEYELTKRDLLESTEDITINVTSLFFEAYSRQADHERAVLSAEDNHKLFSIAQQRFKIGAIAKNELLQLELSMYRSNIAVNDTKISLDVAINNLCTFLGIVETVSLRLIPPIEIPSIQLNYEDVKNLSLQNSSFLLRNCFEFFN